MKLGIVGNYGHMNLGDEALLLGALACATEGIGLSHEDIVVFSDNRDDTEKRIGHLGCEVRQLRRPYGGRVSRAPLVALDVYRNLKGLTHLVFGGGGLLNDSNRTAVPMLAVILAVARLRGIETHWWSVGIGPLRQGWRWTVASWMIRSSKKITVRDKDSASLGGRISGRRLHTVPDLAHALTVEQRNPVQLPPVIMLSVVPYGKPGYWFDENPAQYQQYCNKIVTLIERLLAANANSQIRLFSVGLIQDRACILDITKAGAFDADGRVQISSARTLDALLSELAAARIVVATRLHSLVLGTIAGIPAVTIAYQPKVASYARDPEVLSPCFDIDSFSPELVVSSVLDLLERENSIARELDTMNIHRKKQLLDEIRI